MTPAALCLALPEAMEEVLETMFFAEGEDPPSPDRPDEELVAVTLGFEGSPSGIMHLRIALRAARGLAADFLGEEASEVTPARAAEVACELANMICGSALTQVGSETTFRLSAPEARLAVGAVVESPDESAFHSVELAGGPLSVGFRCTEGCA